MCWTKPAGAPYLDLTTWEFNRVRAGFSPALPTTPRVRVRTGRFTPLDKESSLHHKVCIDSIKRRESQDEPTSNAKKFFFHIYKAGRFKRAVVTSPGRGWNVRKRTPKCPALDRDVRPTAQVRGRLWLTALLQASFPQSLAALQLPFTNNCCIL